MGNCCSGNTVDHNGDIKTLDSHQLAKRITMDQLRLLIKVQANIRGYLCRKRIRQMNYHGGMGIGGYGFQYNEDGEMQ